MTKVIDEDIRAHALKMKAMAHVLDIDEFTVNLLLFVEGGARCAVPETIHLLVVVLAEGIVHSLLRISFYLLAFSNLLQANKA